MKIEIEDKGMSMDKEMDEEKQKWQAECDARTLMEYQKLISDKKRTQAAKNELKIKKEEIMKAIGE